ncbi:MAG: ATP-binding cassette domain-containing protein [Spirochaetaceae bacterium]|nr:ATP-binding cassette domain-containing protein [Spirochaetaceae bacterium]
MSHDMQAALKLLTGVNTRLSSLSMAMDFEGQDSRIKACRALCQYFNTEIKIPPKDIHDTFPDLITEILYLSNLRFKEVVLGEKWWKKDSGALLACDTGGKPLVLLPHAVRGYICYNPETNQSTRFKAAEAGSIRSLALAIFRPFPTKPMKAKEIIAFLAGANIGKELVMIAVFSFLASVVAVIPAVVSKQIFDTIVPNTLRGMLIQVVIVLLCFDIANMGFRVVTNVSISRMITKIGIALYGGIWNRLLGLKLPFFSRYTTGELLQRTQGFSRLKNLFSIDVIQKIALALFSFVNIIVLINLESRTASSVLLMFLCLFFVYGLIARKNFKYQRRYIAVENNIATFNQQIIQGIQRIKVSRAEERVFREWSKYESEKRYLKGRITKLENLNKAVHIFFFLGSPAVVFHLISQNKDVDIGVFVAFIATFMILDKAMNGLIRALDILPEALALSHNIDPILKAEGEYNPEKIIPKDMSGVLEVNHLALRFGDYGKIILKDISFKVGEGQCLGIIGASGCGKSTLMKGLLGFYPLAEGKIFYGGYDLDTIELRFLRKQLGVVLQAGSIPMGKLSDIITDNNPLITRQELMAALEKVDLLSQLKTLPLGLDTPFERYGFNNAERQRLMIARAIVQPRRFMFFDEPTSHQDYSTQHRIFEEIYKIPATKIIVAHRLATLSQCDSIIVLEQGQIVHQGSFEEIMSCTSRTLTECGFS